MQKYEELAARKFYEEFQRMTFLQYKRYLPSWEKLPPSDKDRIIGVFKIWIMVGVINPIKLKELDN